MLAPVHVSSRLCSCAIRPLGPCDAASCVDRPTLILHIAQCLVSYNTLAVRRRRGYAWHGKPTLLSRIHLGYQTARILSIEDKDRRTLAVVRLASFVVYCAAEVSSAELSAQYVKLLPEQESLALRNLLGTSILFVIAAVATKTPEDVVPASSDV